MNDVLKMNKSQKIRDTIVAVRMLLYELEGLRDIIEAEENPNPTERRDYSKEGLCYLCKELYSNWGHNPEPITEFRNRVCDDCHATKIIPARVRGVKKKNE